jgi:hypothetical protein
VRPERSDVAPSGVPGVGVSRRRPPPEEVAYLLQHPEIWERFDRDYWRGAAAQYLQRGLPEGF